MQCGQLNIFVKCEMMEKCEEFDFYYEPRINSSPIKKYKLIRPPLKNARGSVKFYSHGRPI